MSFILKLSRTVTCETPLSMLLAVLMLCFMPSSAECTTKTPLQQYGRDQCGQSGLFAFLMPCAQQVADSLSHCCYLAHQSFITVDTSLAGVVPSHALSAAKRKEAGPHNTGIIPQPGIFVKPLQPICRPRPRSFRQFNGRGKVSGQRRRARQASMVIRPMQPLPKIATV